MGVRGPKSKIEENSFVRIVPHGELTAKEWLDSVEKQKRRSNLKFARDRRRYIQRYRQTESTTTKIVDS